MTRETPPFPESTTHFLRDPVEEEEEDDLDSEEDREEPEEEAAEEAAEEPPEESALYGAGFAVLWLDRRWRATDVGGESSPVEKEDVGCVILSLPE